MTQIIPLLVSLLAQESVVRIGREVGFPIGGDRLIFNPSLSSIGGLPTLEDTVAFEAMLNAVERYPMPKCDPDTRHLAQQVVTDWLCSRDGAGNGEIMWLNGAPGVGKSAIVQTVCEALERSAYNPIHAVHFFGRGQGRREKAFYFPATVAYQLALSNDLYRNLLNSTIQSNPHIFTQAFEPQFRQIVLGPTATTAGVPSFQTPIAVVIDALDEVDNIGDQIALLEVAFSAATKNGMRFLIASRPEQDIHGFFHRPDVHHHIHHVRLDEATFKTSRDIYIFLKKGFARIRQSRPWFFSRGDSDRWPGTAILRRLTVYSDGQFIFSYLIVESIEADRVTPPHEQLQSILDHTAVKTFSKLDTLYHQILSRCLQGTSSTPDRNKARLIGVLRAIICWPQQLSITAIANVLGEETFVVENVIRGPMRCLFKVKDDRQGSHVMLCHKSLRDCVVNRSRAGDFFVGSNNPNISTLDVLYHEILSRCLQGPPSQHDRNKDLLMRTLRVIISWPNPLSIAGIADVLVEEESVVRDVLQGPMRSLFTMSSYFGIELCDRSLKSYILNRSSAGDFFIGSDTRDVLYHEILSRCLRGPPSQRDRNKDLLMGILRVITCWPVELSIAGIADVLDEEESVVGDVIRGPMRSLFDISPASSVQLCDKLLRDYVLTQSRSGEFFISSNEPDELFIEILSRPPPSDPRHAFPPHLLMGVLQCIQVHDCMPTIDTTLEDIASNLNVDPGVVRRVLHGPHRALFRHFSQMDAKYTFATNTFGEFLADHCRSGRWSIPYSRAADAVVARTLSIPLPCDPQNSFSRQDLIGFLRVSKMWSSHPLSLPEIISVLGIEARIVKNVVCGPQSGLWRSFWWRVDLSEALVKNNFFSDASRSGEFHVSQDSEDALLISLLSLPPPTDPQKSFSRHDLRTVLHVICCFERSLTIPEIASILCIDPRAVSDVISGPQQSFFWQGDGRICFSPTVDARKFFRDTKRSGKFHLSDTDSASLLLPILSLPAPPERSFSRQELMGIFLATIMLGDNAITIDDIAFMLAIEPNVALNVVKGPQQLLFCMGERDGTAVIWSALHHSWFDNSYSSEGFCITAGEIDALFISVLSRPPPTDTRKTYLRQDLIAVICTVLTFNGLCYYDIASASGLERRIVENVIQGPHQVLFTIHSSQCFPSAALRSFFTNPHRSREFYVSRDDLDASLTQYLYRPPPVTPERSYSRQCLMGIVQLLFVSPPSTLERMEDLDVASKLNFSCSTVRNIIRGPHSALFKTEYYHTMNSDWISLESRVLDFKGFLLDPTRSGEFYLGP